MAAIRLKDLTLGYARHPAVHHLDGCLESGSLTAVVGPNGAGKSTLLKGMAGLLPALEGSVELVGADSRAIAYLPQQADIDADFPISVLDAVLLGHWRRAGAFRALTPDMIEAAERALEAVGMAGLGRRPIGALSVGQRQRVLFARVVVQDCPIILLDEPFAAVDSRTAGDLLEVVLRWHDERRTVVAVLHDFEQVRQHFPLTLLLAREIIGWGPTPDVLTPAGLARARVLCETWSEDAPVCRRTGT